MKKFKSITIDGSVDKNNKLTRLLNKGYEIIDKSVVNESVIYLLHYDNNIREYVKNIYKSVDFNPPLSRVQNTACTVFCDICGSTKTRKPFWFGKRSCDNVKCTSNTDLNEDGVFGKGRYEST